MIELRAPKSPPRSDVFTLLLNYRQIERNYIMPKRQVVDRLTGQFVQPTDRNALDSPSRRVVLIPGY